MGALMVVLACSVGLAKAPGAGAVARDAPVNQGRTTPSSQAVCGPVTAGHARCAAWRRTDIVRTARSDSSSDSGPSPQGYAPADLISAYAIPTGLGQGRTVAIVAAYNDPTADADLAVYRAQYHLPACTTASGCLSLVSQSGSSTKLPPSGVANGWATEQALDTEMVSAACPLCRIVLVEADGADNFDLYTAENWAAEHTGAVAVSNSWGGPESPDDLTSNTEYFTHPGVAIIAAAGDGDYGVNFPASSPEVIAVGGTSLSRTRSNTRGWNETVWNEGADAGTGSGCSAYQSQPSWQSALKLGGCTERIDNDLAADADPATGVNIYDTSSGGWTICGGTSLASPLITAMYALAHPTHPTAAAIYAAAGTSALHDVSTGSNLPPTSPSSTPTCAPAYLCTAGIGYDGPTGNGTPQGLVALGGPATGPVLPTSR